MRKRNFFTYTFKPRVIAIAVAGGSVKWLGVYWAYRLQWTSLVWGLTIVYGIFCALFIVVSYRKWQRYKRWN